MNLQISSKMLLSGNKKDEFITLFRTHPDKLLQIQLSRETIRCKLLFNVHARHLPGLKYQ
jgi:hypothetical protein